MSSLLAAYRQRLAEGELAPDADQARAAEQLEVLEKALERWKPGGWPIKAKPPRGLYLWGPVGRGKSMLLDLFFEAAPVKKSAVCTFTSSCSRSTPSCAKRVSTGTVKIS